MKTTRSYLVLSQSFLEPLHTSRGILNEKKNLVLREEDETGKISFGEVSPLPGFWEFDFGVALDQAKEWCLHRTASKGFSCLGPALGCLHSNIWDPLIPKTKLPSIANLWTSEKYMVFDVIKRKIGLQSHKEEIAVICSWLDQLPVGVKVRLDPNESFSREELQRWIDALIDRSCVEFIEQPTGRKDDDWLIEFSKNSPIPIALDEAIYRLGSINSIYGLPKNLFLVIKPMLFSDWELMAELLKKRREKVIISTSFESPFGYEAVVRLSSDSLIAPGLDRSSFHGSPLEFCEHHNSVLSSPAVSVKELDKLWDLLAK